MANMVLDSYTFTKQPGEMTMIEGKKYASSILTYTSIAYFSWGVTIVGKLIVLKWGGMPTAQYDELQQKYANDVEILFDPQQGDGKTYNVEIKRLEGKYHLSLLDSASFRKDIEMDLLIMSEV